jgi:hypothetical protein
MARWRKLADVFVMGGLVPAIHVFASRH